MKETGVDCTELANMCEVEAVASSHRRFMGLAALEIEVVIWASKSKKNSK